ncbi:MAG: hypothetical protein GXY44_09955 [Phycisphaerales bacterium]|nr:hypothetical protein [Phycisphaerales bacterium]
MVSEHPSRASLPEVISRVNRNSEGMDFMLRAGNVRAVGKYRKGGKLESFDAGGTLLFRKPRDLYLKLSYLTGSIEIGSNAQEWWVWNQVDNHYWWSQHGDIIQDSSLMGIPIRADHLVEILGLSNLPIDTVGPHGPLYDVQPERFVLGYVDQDMAGQLYYTKWIAIDRFPPYLIRELYYFRPSGYREIAAFLSNYGPIDNTDGAAVMAPRKIRIEWLADESWSELTFGGMRRFGQEQARRAENAYILESPRIRRRTDLGTVERVGAPPPATLPATIPATGPSTEL